MGRPRSITAEMETEFFNLVASGLTIQSACLKARISYTSVTTRKFTSEPFRLALARACISGCVFALDDAEHRLRTSSNKRIAVDREVAHHARWKAAALLPEYSKRLELVQPRPLHPTETEQITQIEGARHLAFAIARGAHYAEQRRQP